MEEYTYIKSNVDLLRSAKTIFGDIVTSAYITTWGFSKTPSSELRERINQVDIGFKTLEIDYSGEYIILGFSTGAHVKFTNSEWASMQAIDISHYRNIED